MSKKQILIIIEKAINACQTRDASTFSSLFTTNSKIILNKNTQIIKPEIEKVTADYFANLKYIKIKVHDILIKENKALVEWSWEDYNFLTKQKNSHDNVISLQFQDGLIISWREYKG